MSAICGVPLTPTKDSTLSEMIETGIAKMAAQLEDISAAATKEFQLEKNLTKMRGEWAGIKFECIPYRETGVNILSALDDIQTMLDDHILKAQTMRGSPFIKPLEKEMKRWEEKLITMQDIIDAWIKVQSTWMYLEPIFSSPDVRTCPYFQYYHVCMLRSLCMCDMHRCIPGRCTPMLFKSCNRMIEKTNNKMTSLFLDHNFILFPMVHLFFL
jgi:hypothetical protein